MSSALKKGFQVKQVWETLNSCPLPFSSCSRHLGPRKPAQLRVTSLPRRVCLCSCPELLCPRMDVSREERARGHFLLFPALLSAGLSSASAWPCLPLPSSPSRKQMRKALGDEGSWPPWPQLFQPVFSCCRCPREQAGAESPRPGWLAALRKALELALWPCSPPRPPPTPWDAGLGSGQASPQ